MRRARALGRRDYYVKIREREIPPPNDPASPKKRKRPRFLSLKKMVLQ